MYTIGFTTKFYTLWDVTVEHFTNAYGRKGERVTANYIKNISMDEQAARAKYPDAPVDLGLRGHSSFCRTHWEPLPSDVFPCGQYMGQSIADCTDFGYLYWAVDRNMLCGESREIAVDALLKSGQYVYYAGLLMKAEIAAEYEQADAALDELIAGIDETGVIEVESVSNVRGIQDEYNEQTYMYSLKFWSATKGNVVNVEWHEQMVQRFSYYDMEYWLPLKGGKAKRIKGKNLKIVVDSYTVEQFSTGRQLNVVVKDFEIIK